MSVDWLLPLLTGIIWTAEGSLTFTEEPKGPLYFMEGSNIKIKWSYPAELKGGDLKSVVWSVKNKTDGRIYALIVDDLSANFTVNPIIPAAYRDRVVKINQATLVVKSATFVDTTRFSCKLRSKRGSSFDKTSAEVDVIVTGHASVHPEVQCAKAGDPVTFTCNATGVPSANFTWSRNYGDRKERLVSGVPVLHVNMSGYYECNATANPDQPNIAQGYLEVIKPEPLQEDDKANLGRSFEIAVGDNKTLCCPVKGYPPPFVTWKKNGMLLQTKVDKCYPITSAKDDQFGNYTCSASDGTKSVGPFTISLTSKSVASIDVQPSDSGKLKWSNVSGAQHYVVKITGKDLLDDVRCRVGKQPFMDLHFNALVLKEAEKNLEETKVCVKVAALSDDDDVLAKTPTCQSMTIKSGEVTRKPNIMFLVVIVYSGWKML